MSRSSHGSPFVLGSFLFLTACRGPLPSHEPRPAGAVSLEARIREAEDARDWSVQLLDGALYHTDPALRARVLLGLARTRDPRHLERIASMLEDRSAPVLQMALFALETTAPAPGAPAAPPAKAVAGVRSLLGHPSFDVRTWAARAAGRLADDRLRPALRELLKDSFSDVRGAAAVSLGRLKDHEAVGALDALTLDLDSGLRGKIAWALAEIGGAAVRGSLLRLAVDVNTEVRIASLRGLAPFHDADVRGLFLTAVQDPDPRIRLEGARGLASETGPTAEEAYHRLLRDPVPDLRGFAARELLRRGGRPLGSMLQLLLRDPRPEVASIALVALARQGAPERSAAIAESVASPDPRARAAAAPALASCGDPSSLETLRRLARDPSPIVRSAALDAARDAGGDLYQTLLLAALQSPDTGDRGRASEHVLTLRDAWAVEPIKGSLRLSTGRGDVTIRANLLDALTAIDPKEALPFLERGLSDPLAAVRVKAWTLLVRAGRAPAIPSPEAPWAERLPDFARAFDRPTTATVLLKTARGSVRLRLLAAEAPVHVYRFLYLARTGFYNGLTFHAVETGVRAAGGDPRGDGWGDAGWLLRDELYPRPILRGTVCVEQIGRDAGGCRFFIATGNRPDLDGVATAFAEVVEGMDVVDQLEPGDVIQSITEK